MSVTPLLKTSIWFLITWKMKSKFLHGWLPTSWCDLAQLSLRLLKGPIPPWRFSHFICLSSTPSWNDRLFVLKVLPPYCKCYSFIWPFGTTRKWVFLPWCIYIHLLNTSVWHILNKKKCFSHDCAPSCIIIMLLI